MGKRASTIAEQPMASSSRTKRKQHEEQNLLEFVAIQDARVVFSNQATVPQALGQHWSTSKATFELTPCCFEKKRPVAI